MFRHGMLFIKMLLMKAEQIDSVSPASEVHSALPLCNRRHTLVAFFFRLVWIVVHPVLFCIFVLLNTVTVLVDFLRKVASTAQPCMYCYIYIKYPRELVNTYEEFYRKTT